MITKAMDSSSAEITEQLAGTVAKHLRGGELIELVSDLGGGKTTFVRGFVAALESTNPVTSPTFKISNVYATKHFTVYHFDFYRLTEADQIIYELHDALEDPRGITIVEWGNVVADALPETRLQVKLTATGDESRKLVFQYPESMSYMMEGIQ